ncbi:hypothetical protein Cgig2_029919 [Carnegiea gigantea]|uniref:Reverse transcriptase n=1 Tax=Carnegiea gigantea TaxID=171969 RepID=A0A9Q1KJS8_9CARY|nr:hypothetical protein Cgig2_029919 [Carnegiea gigantea]
MWLNLRDHYTKQFFTKMKQREMQSFVYSIQDGQGRHVEGFKEVARVFVEYYQDLLGEQPIIRDQIDKRVMQTGAILSVEQHMVLLEPITDNDIKEAFWDIPTIKSPNPDGATDSNTAQALQSTFEKFSRCSGLRANREKSQVVMGECTEVQKQPI